MQNNPFAQQQRGPKRALHPLQSPDEPRPYDPLTGFVRHRLSHPLQSPLEQSAGFVQHGNAPGVPFGVHFPRRAPREQDYGEEQQHDPYEDEERSKRKRTSSGVIGEGESYTVPDSFERIKEVKARGNVRSEPNEREPWDALRKYAHEAKLARPVPSDNYFASRDSVDLFVSTIDYVRMPPGEAHRWAKSGAVVRLFGVTTEGHSGAVFVHNFWPYLYANLPAKLVEDIAEYGQEEALKRFSLWLDKQTRARDLKRRDGDNERYIRSVEIVSGKLKSAMYWQRDVGTYLRITTQLPRYVPIARDVLSKRNMVLTPEGRKKVEREIAYEVEPEVERSNRRPYVEEDEAGYQEDIMDTENPEYWMLPDDQQRITIEELRKPENAYGRDAVQVYECDIPFVLRFMVDKDISGCGWVSVPKAAVQYESLCGRHLRPQDGVDLGCLAQVSLAVDAEHIKSQTTRSDVPDELRLVSLDIEAAPGRAGQFPIPANDPVICLSVNLYKLKNGMRPTARIGFSVGDVNPIPELTHCVQFKADPEWNLANHTKWSIDGRRDMLLALRWLMADCWDYDFLMGYNLPFDQSYVNKQADAIGIGDAFRRYSRMREELCTSKVTSFSSKAMGTRDTLAFISPGRISWDILDQVKRDITLKLRSNALNTVAMEVAGISKHEMPYQLIGPLWMTDPRMATTETRTRILRYNENDEKIAADVNARKGYLWNAIEICRTTGVSVEMFMHRGAGIRSVSMILRNARRRNYIFPTYASRTAKRAAAGFGVTPEGTLHKYEREIDEALAADDPMDLEPQDRAAHEQAVIDRINEKFGIDQLLFSPKDSCYFATTAPGHEEANLGLAMRTNTWYAADEARSEAIKKEYAAARTRGGRLLLFFVNYVDAKDTSVGKQRFYGVAQVVGLPVQRPPLTEDEIQVEEEGPRWEGVNAGPTFKIRWLHKFSTSVAGSKFNPQIPWKPALSIAGIPMQARQARLLMDLCRLRRAVPKVDLNLEGKPIEANTIEAYLRRKRKREAAENGEDEEEEDVNRNIANEFDLPETADDEEGGDDDEDKYSGAVVLETIVGLYRVPVSTLDFASLYPSIIILHNLCYTSILTRDLIRLYKLKESDKDPNTGLYVDPPNNDYTIKESGHMVMNDTVHKGLLPEILQNLLKKRGVSKVFMGAAGKIKSLMIDGLNKEPTNVAKWRDADEAMVTGTGKERGESFLQLINKLEKDTKPIIDKALAQWLDLKAHFDASEILKASLLCKTLPEVAESLAKKSDVAGEIRDTLAKLLAATKAVYNDPSNAKNRKTVEDLLAAARKLADGSGEVNWTEELESLERLWEDVSAGLTAASARFDDIADATAALREAFLFEISVLHQLFDARQNALKIAANSIYGFTGARVGKYPMRAVAEVTTSEGRASIMKKMHLVERMYPLPKRFTYGPTIAAWKSNGLVPREEIERAERMTPEEFKAELAKKVEVRTKCKAYGATKAEWEANAARVPAAELARARTESQEEFDKHLKEIEPNGWRPIVIGGDTDSIFIVWPNCTTPTDAHDLAKGAAVFVNLHFRKPQETTYEKTFYDAIYNALKKYAGVMWEPGKEKPKQEPKPGGGPKDTQDAIMAKGLEMVRRDSTVEVADAIGVALRKILVERSYEGACAFAAELIELHRTQRANLAKLLMSKSLSKPPEQYNPRPIHAKVALKMRERNPATAPVVGERVPFFVVQPDHKGARTTDMGEDPAYVIANNLALNTEHYLDKLLKPALRRVLEPIRPGTIAFLFEGVPLNNGQLIRMRSAIDGTDVGVSAKDRPKELKDIKEGRKGSDHEPSNYTLRWAKKISAVDDSRIESAVKDKIESMRKAIGFDHVPWNTPLLFLSRDWRNLDKEAVNRCMTSRGAKLMGVTTTTAAAPAPVVRRGGGGPLVGIGTVRRMCCICRTRQLRDASHTVCEHCRTNALDKVGRIRSIAATESKEAQQKDEEAWNKCFKCAGSEGNALECGATACDNYYVRRVTTTDRATSAAWYKSLTW